MTLRVLDLFSGVGGFALGFKRAGGFKTVGYCEIDPFCREVLQARIEDGSLDAAPIHADVRQLQPVEADVVCGGFPCQDVSPAGRCAGIAGERSGLWREMGRLIRGVRPRYVVVENSAGLLDRGFGDVLGDLSSYGYDAEWSTVSACSLGAPHMRERVFLVAYPHRQSGGRHVWEWEQEAPWGGWWTREPALARVAHGVPGRVDRNTALGNALIPQIAEWIGRRIANVGRTRLPEEAGA